MKGMKNMKRVLAILLSACLMLSLAPTSAFAEIYDEAEIQNLLSMLDIMVGSTDGNFYPDNLVTRAEFTKVAVMASAYRNAVPENSTTSPFGDVPYSLWSAPYITLGVDNNLLSGYPDSTFRPENPVLLEEAVTICLKLLGYSEADYGKVWPSGPISLARSLELLDNIEKSTGEYLQRRDVMYLIYNTINTKIKGTQNELINSLNYTYLEDTTLIATGAQDSSVGKNKIVTSSGTYKMGDSFDSSMVGRKGDAFIKNGDTLVSFIPDNQTFETHAVYSVLNGDIIVYDNGATDTLDVEKDLTCYSGSKSGTVSAYLSTLQTGDSLKIAYDEDGDIDYMIHSSDELKGPYAVYSSNWMTEHDIKQDASIIKNGKNISASDVELYDVVYYSKDLNLVWAYASKVTGTYEKASPNQENPTSVTIAGNTYSIEGVTAFNKLSSNGSCKLGDTVTVLLGRNGEVADVLTGSTEVVQYGYVIQTGTKEFTSASGNPETAYYAKIVTAEGNELEFKTERNYELLMNKVVTAKISNGNTTLSSVNANSQKLTGRFSYNKMALDSYKLADDLQILDILAFADASKTPDYITVFPQRLDNIELRKKDIICATFNENNEIDRLFLNDVTGDGYAYGVVTSAETQSGPMTSVGSYTCNIAGAEMHYSGAIILQLSTGHPVQAAVKNNAVSSLSKLRQLSRKITKIDESFAYASTGEKYAFGNNVVVYKHPNSSSTYNLISIEDLDLSVGSCDFYYNNTLENGGRIRVIIWNTPLN